MILDSKTRILDGTFTKSGKYFLVKGSGVASFRPLNLSSDCDKSTGFRLTHANSDVINLINNRTSLDGINTPLGPINQTKKSWVRVIRKNDQLVDNFGNGFKPITDLESSEIGLPDIMMAISKGQYFDGEETQENGILVSSEDREITINGSEKEFRYEFKGFPKDKKYASQLVKPDLVAQSEFSKFVNGMFLPPVVRGSEQNQPEFMNEFDINEFETDRLTSRTIRNRLVEDNIPYVELDVDVKNRNAGEDFNALWIPVERRRFKINVGDDEFELEMATAMDIIRYDNNMYFIGKIVPIIKDDIGTNVFLRIFTVIFEDGT
jgi:hypothetical protein